MTLTLEGEISEILSGENRTQVGGNEERFQQLFENDLTGDYFCTPEGTIRLCNPAFASIFGFTSTDEAIGTSMLELYVDPRERDAMLEELRRERKLRRCEAWRKRREGVLIHIVENLVGHFNELGELYEIQGYIFDDTDRRKAEEALRESESRFRTLVEGAPEGIYVHHSDDRFAYLNPRMLTMLGASRAEELLGKEIIAQVAPERRQSVRERIELQREIGKAVPSKEQEYLRVDGSRLPVETTAVRTNFGGTEAHLVFVRDISDRKRAEEVLRERDETYEAIVNQSEEGIVLVDCETLRFVQFNDVACRDLGYSREEFIHLTLFDIQAATSREEFIERVQSVVRRGAARFENKQRRKDGTIREMLISNRVIHLHGHPYLAGIWQDITERKRAEEEKERLQSQLASALEMARLGHWEYDVATDLFTFNDHFYKIFRTTVEQVGKYTMSSAEYAQRFVHPDDIPIVGEEVRKAIEATDSNFSSKVEHRMLYGDGTAGFISVHFFIVKNAQGKTVKTYGVNQDITERKQAEEALRRSEATLSSIFRAAPVGLCIMKDRVYQNANAFWCQGFGYPEEEILGKNTRMLYASAEEYERVGRALYTIHGGLGLASTETRLRRRDGVFRDVVLTAASLDSDELSAGTVVAIHDITERKRAEEEKEKLDAQLRQAQKTEAIGTLAGGIAHDFNNILGAIIGYSELALSDAEENVSVRSDIEEVLKGANRAKDLVKQILAFSRMTEQEKKPFQAALIVKEAMGMLRATLPTTIDITQDIRSKGIMIGDPTQIHQVLMNLCTNAAQAMREHGGLLNVRLLDTSLGPESIPPHSVLKPGPHLNLVVSDTGPGIDPAILDRIFDPFFTTKQKAMGTGLGLSVVHGIVRSHGGSIEVKSHPGKGTAFQVLFPAAERAPMPQTVDSGPVPRGEERILFVDDEPAITSLNKQMLERLGYEVDCRTSGVEALETFRRHLQDKPFDLVITDMTMPQLTGADLAKMLLKIQPTLPIILCTGFSEVIDAEKARKVGIRGFLMKPIEGKELARLIRDVLDGEIGLF